MILLFLVLVLAGTHAADHGTHFDQEALHANAMELNGAPEFAAIFNASERQLIEEKALEEGSYAELDSILGAKAAIEVLINPEIRVSVRRLGPPRRTSACGQPVVLLLKIVNHGFATGDLHVVNADTSSNERLTPVLLSPRLTGARTEYRILRIDGIRPTLTDVTLQFNIGPLTADIGNRDQLFLTLQCS